MKYSSLDRRQAVKAPVFPLTDSNGNEIRSDRRSGKVRRKNRQYPNIVSKILDSIN